MEKNNNQILFEIEENIRKEIPKYVNNVEKYRIKDSHYMYYTGNVDAYNLLFLMKPSSVQHYWAKKERLNDNFKLTISEHRILLRNLSNAGFNILEDFLIVYCIPFATIGDAKLTNNVKEELEWISYNTFTKINPKRVFTFDYETAEHITGIDLLEWEDSIGKEFTIENGSQLYMLSKSMAINLELLYYKFKGEEYLWNKMKR